MCIAIWKPEGEDLLSKDIYEQCWSLNPHGGSISFWNKEDKLWYVTKGLMEWEDWWEKYCEMRNEGIIGKDVGVFIHFRVGTAGKSFEAALTHPFPISAELKDLQVTEFKARNIIAHNGTIGEGNKDGTASDTMEAVLDYVEPMWDLVYYKNGQVRNKKLERILQECLDTAKSRWFIANGPEVTLYGPWIHDTTYGTHFSKDDYDNPWYGWGYDGGMGGAYAGHGGVYSGALDRRYTAKFIRSGSMEIYLTPDGDWDWEAWKQLNEWGDKPSTSTADNNTVLTDEDDMKTEHERDNELMLAVLDEDGILHWEDDWETDEDLLCCPDCASDDIVEYSGLNIADYACHVCGGLFDSKTGEVLAYDQQIPEMEIGECMYCDKEVFIESSGNCAECGAILDLKEVKNGN